MCELYVSVCVSPLSSGHTHIATPFAKADGVGVSGGSRGTSAGHSVCAL